ncbi:hypothetical protein BpHYR1_015872 [Brachionus plicatilis]|uniref:Uncharacterized protein n=1 Tax=Brachionus plicatilis TaxID=10195 RepID=A0A3M7QWK8_BRAPC|nr:hypothetical protein BpHYR1_015872 [Brachionus plicatilis]
MMYCRPSAPLMFFSSTLSITGSMYSSQSWTSTGKPYLMAISSCFKKSESLKIGLFLFFLHPLERLLLRINAVGKSARLNGQYAILNGQLVRRQTLTAPLAYFNIGCEQIFQLKWLRQGHLFFQQVLLPSFEQQLAPKLPSKCAHIGQKGRTQQTIAQQLDPLVFQQLQVFTPSLVLRTKTIDQFVSSNQSSFHNGRLLLQLGLFSLLCFQFVRQFGQLSLNFGHLIVDSVELACRVMVLFFQLGHFVPFGLDCLEHSIVAEDGVHKLKQTGTSSANIFHF